MMMEMIFRDDDRENEDEEEMGFDTSNLTMIARLQQCFWMWTMMRLINIMWMSMMM